MKLSGWIRRADGVLSIVLTLSFVILVGAKLTGATELSWLIVTSPAWGVVLLLITWLCVVVIVAAIGGTVQAHEDLEARRASARRKRRRRRR